MIITLLFLLFLIEGQEETDLLCGPKSLLVVCKLLGVKADLEELCRLSGWEAGTTMYDLYRAARKKGLYAVGMRLDIEELKKIGQPAIAHVRGDHFLVVAGFLGYKVCIIDPPNPPRLISKGDFLKQWDGCVLVVSKEPLPFSQREDFSKGPDIHFPQRVYDFGEVPQGTRITYTFPFYNSGDSLLVISRVVTSCGCTAALPSGKEIPPGEKGWIKVEFNVGMRLGETAEEVYVHSNDPEEPIVVLRLEGRVKPRQGRVVVLPDRIYFGEVNWRKPRVRRVEVLHTGGKKVKVEGIEVSSSHLSAEVVDTSGGKVAIRLALGPLKELGEFRDTLRVYVPGDTLEVPVEAEVVGNIRVFPDRFFFGLVRVGRKEEREVEVFGTEGMEFKIEGIGNSCGSVFGEYYEVGPGRYKVKAVLLAKEEGLIKDTLRVYTDDPRQPVLEVPLYGQVVSEGR